MGVKLSERSTKTELGASFGNEKMGSQKKLHQTLSIITCDSKGTSLLWLC
jgi:hypothetical protein